jgi:hypothetical protein
VVLNLLVGQRQRRLWVVQLIVPMPAECTCTRLALLVTYPPSSISPAWRPSYTERYLLRRKIAAVSWANEQEQIRKKADWVLQIVTCSSLPSVANNIYNDVLAPAVAKVCSYLAGSDHSFGVVRVHMQDWRAYSFPRAGGVR